MGRSQVAEAPDKRSQMGYNELYYYWVNTIIIIIYSLGDPKWGEINTVIIGSLLF
jgi:hypothetical protein